MNNVLDAWHMIKRLIGSHMNQTSACFLPQPLLINIPSFAINGSHTLNRSNCHLLTKLDVRNLINFSISGWLYLAGNTSRFQSIKKLIFMSLSKILFIIILSIIIFMNNFPIFFRVI